MKFNYVKEAKRLGCDNFPYCYEMKYLYGDNRYMAAHWLAWYYVFKRENVISSAARNFNNFLYEIQNICANKE